MTDFFNPQADGQRPACLTDYRLMLHQICRSPWMMHEEKLTGMVDLLAALASGAQLREDISQNIHRSAPRNTGAVAVFPVHGFIQQRPDFFTRIFGGFVIEEFLPAFRAAVSDPDITSIVLDIDSPGGSVFGLDELSKEIFAARSEKKIVAVANPFAASAAVYIGASATEFIVAPSGQAGSIGTIIVHVEMSKALDEAGIQVNMIRSPEAKAAVNSFESLSDEERKHLQAQVDEYYAQFTAAVARGRGVTAAAVKGGFGLGRMMNAKDAVASGLCDRADTLERVLAKLSGRSGRKGMRAEVNPEGDSITITGDGSGNSLPGISESDLEFLDSVPLVKTETDETKNLAANIERRRRRLSLMRMT